jgi:hypothetical protein
MIAGNFQNGRALLGLQRNSINRDIDYGFFHGKLQLL